MKANSDDESKTLLAFLRDHLEEYPSVKAIKRAIEAGQCKINGRIETFSTHRIKSGDEIDIALEVDRQRRPLEILFEDHHLIFYNKPAGISSEELTPYLLVHRLDKPTSGVIVMAKDKDTQNKMIDLFRQRKVQKTYLAICDGKIEKTEWVVDNFLEKKASYEGGSLYGRGSKEKGKKATTKFKLLTSKDAASLVEAYPITGRTHQIRVHLKEDKHPVLGDYQYSQHFECRLWPPRLMLHSLEISFAHPHTKEPIDCKAPPPSDFNEMTKTLFETY